jgi:hypothetical protein
VTPQRWLALGVGLALVALLAFAGLALGKARRAAYDAAVARSNERAALDTSKVYRTKFDSTQLVTGRLQEQATIREQNLGGALQEVTAQLKLVTKSVQSLNVQVAGIKTSVVSGNTLVLHDTVGRVIGRKLDFTLTGPPISGTVAVTAPSDTMAPGKLDVDLKVSPFALRMSLACDKNKDVQFLTEAPPWVTVGVTRGTVEPEVCHGARPSWFSGLGGLRNGVLVGAGVVGGVLLKSTILR